MTNSAFDPESSIELPLKTERLMLTRVLADDAETIEVLLGDKQVAATTRSIDYPYPKDGAAKSIANNDEAWARGQRYVFAVRLIGESEEPLEHPLIGTIELQLDAEDHSAEMGFWIGREFWNQGYCTEAAKQILEFGFQKFGLQKINSHHMAKNPACGRVLEKAGFSKEGFLKRHVRKWGVFEDVVLYAILRTEWETKP